MLANLLSSYASLLLTQLSSTMLCQAQSKLRRMKQALTTGWVKKNCSPLILVNWPHLGLLQVNYLYGSWGKKLVIKQVCICFWWWDMIYFWFDVSFSKLTVFSFSGSLWSRLNCKVWSWLACWSRWSLLVYEPSEKGNIV